MSSCPVSEYWSVVDGALSLDLDGDVRGRLRDAPLRGLPGERPGRTALGSTASGRHTHLALAGRSLQRRLGLRYRLKPTETLLALLAQVCRDFDVPAGPVVYGHTHQPHGPVRAPGENRWTFHNSGSWMYDEFLLSAWGSQQQLARPGTCLRVHDGRIERRELLAGVTNAQLLAMAQQAAAAL